VTSPASGAGKRRGPARLRADPPVGARPGAQRSGVFRSGGWSGTCTGSPTGVYQSAFLTTRDGVVVFDRAPRPSAANLRRAVDEIAAANGVPSTVTHFVYSHPTTADPRRARPRCSAGDVVRIGHEETKRLLLREQTTRARPVPEVTFADRYTPSRWAVERAELAWARPPTTRRTTSTSTSPGHDTLMFIDVVKRRLGAHLQPQPPPRTSSGTSAPPDIALSYPWTHFISGHLGRLATPRGTSRCTQQYIADIQASAAEALAAVDPIPFYVAGGENVWAGVKAHLDAVTERAGARAHHRQVHTGVLAAADIEIFTRTTTFQIMQSLRPRPRARRQQPRVPCTPDRHPAGAG